ncbi:MAG: transaldolase [Candidatus Lokiarchaeota archaeon]|nr:transaldolase [Candidatus Lokiarchaeota archaeon]
MTTPLEKTAEISDNKTDIWNDSCSVEELNYSIKSSHCVGATSNPVIVGNVLKQEMHLWKDRIYEIIEENPQFSEIDVTWQLIHEITQKGADILKPIFDREKGLKGRLSIQTNPKNWRNTELMWKQAVEFDKLAPNIIVKIPVTKAGVKAIEEATYRGVNINATVCFSVTQCLAVGEAVEKGIKRRKNEGHDVSQMTPVCTLMVGRQDDWLKVVANKKNIITDPWNLEWAGVAAIKKAYKLFNERGYRAKLLAAAYRNHLHWSELIGGNVILTLPYKWQKRFNNSDIEVKKRMDNPVDPKIIEGLYKAFPIEWKKGYDEKGMTIDEFDTYGASQRTLRQFIEGYDNLVAVIRDFMVPNPDV